METNLLVMTVFLTRFSWIRSRIRSSTAGTRGLTRICEFRELRRLTEIPGVLWPLPWKGQV